MLALGGGPVFLFGVFWQGGDMERYLPLYPFFFLAVAWALGSGQGYKVTRGVVAGFFLLAGVVNAWSYSRWEVEHDQRQPAGVAG